MEITTRAPPAVPDEHVVKKTAEKKVTLIFNQGI